MLFPCASCLSSRNLSSTMMAMKKTVSRKAAALFPVLAAIQELEDLSSPLMAKCRLCTSPSMKSIPRGFDQNCGATSESYATWQLGTHWSISQKDGIHLRSSWMKGSSRCPTGRRFILCTSSVFYARPTSDDRPLEPCSLVNSSLDINSKRTGSPCPEDDAQCSCHPNKHEAAAAGGHEAEALVKRSIACSLLEETSHVNPSNQLSITHIHF